METNSGAEKERRYMIPKPNSLRITTIHSTQCLSVCFLETEKKKITPLLKKITKATNSISFCNMGKWQKKYLGKNLEKNQEQLILTPNFDPIKLGENAGAKSSDCIKDHLCNENFHLQIFCCRVLFKNFLQLQLHSQSKQRKLIEKILWVKQFVIKSIIPFLGLSRFTKTCEIDIKVTDLDEIDFAIIDRGEKMKKANCTKRKN